MEAQLLLTANIMLSVVLGGLIGLFVYLYHVLWLKPMRLRSKLQNQGIKAPSSPYFLHGNSTEIKRIQFQTKSKSNQKEHHHQEGGPSTHNWPADVFPHIQQWRNEYGNVQILCITDPEMAKEVNLCTSWSLGKPSFISRHMGPLLGRGIFSSSGQYWAQQRKIIAPEFYHAKVKVQYVPPLIPNTVSELALDSKELLLWQKKKVSIRRKKTWTIKPKQAHKE